MQRFHILYSYIRACYFLLIRVNNIVKLIFSPKLVNSETYYPEYSDKRKTRLRIFYDQFVNIIKYARPNYFYFLYGLDIRDRKNEYVDYTEFMTYRDKLNNSHQSKSTVGVLRDKLFFGLVAESLGISTPDNIGIIQNGQLFKIKDKTTETLIDFFNGESALDIFVKDIDGECADGVFHIVYKNCNLSVNGEDCDIEHLLSRLADKRYVVQNTIKQHPDVSKIFGKSLNTIRVATVKDNKRGEIVVLPPLLRIGRGDSSVDNWAVGGIAVGIDTDHHTLKKYGFYKPGFGTKVTSHPDTGVEFDGYKIPYIKESIALVKNFHKYFKDVHSIGWDIAITEDGPMIIEGNDNWEISLIQVCSRGLKDEFKIYFKR